MSKQHSKNAVPSLGKQLLTSLSPKVIKPNAEPMLRSSKAAAAPLTAPIIDLTAPMFRSSKALAAPLTAVAKPTPPIIDLTSDEETKAAPMFRSSKAAVAKPTPPIIQPAVAEPTKPMPMFRSSKAAAAPLTAVAKPTPPIIDLTSDEETNAAPMLRSSKSKAAVAKPTQPIIQPAVSKLTPPIIQPAVSKPTQPIIQPAVAKPTPPIIQPAVAEPTKPIIEVTTDSDEETNAAPMLRSSKAAVAAALLPAVAEPVNALSNSLQPAVVKPTQPANELTIDDEEIDCWTCDICMVKCFLDFDEACAHEKICNGNDIDDDGQTTGGFTIEYIDGQTVGNLNGELVDGQTTGQLVAVVAVPHHTSSKRKHDDDSLALVQFAGKRRNCFFLVCFSLHTSLTIDFHILAIFVKRMDEKSARNAESGRNQIFFQTTLLTNNV